MRHQHCWLLYFTLLYVTLAQIFLGSVGLKLFWSMFNRPFFAYRHKFKTNCCYGLSMDLLENVAEELEFDFQLYIVADGLFGTKTISENGEPKWNGIMGDLVSGAAHLSFSALSVSSPRYDTDTNTNIALHPAPSPIHTNTNANYLYSPQASLMSNTLARTVKTYLPSVTTSR